MHTTTEAIQASISALQDGIHVEMLRQCLMAEGFKPNKAATIVRWALQFQRKNNGYVSSPQMGRRKPVR
jgi:hypothetical protein